MKSRMLVIAVVLLAVVVAVAAPAQTKGWASNVRIVFFPGGPEGGVFAVNVYNGAKQAELDLGCKVNYVWSDWDPQKMIQQFREAVATRPDGIAIMGHPGDAAFDALIDDAESKGIIVTSQNTTLEKAEAKYAANGFGYVGAENYPAGHALGVEAVKRFKLKSGDRAMVWGLLSQPARGAAHQGRNRRFQGGRLEGRLPRDRCRDEQGPCCRRSDICRLRLLASGREGGRHRSRRPHRHCRNLLKAAGKKAGQINIAGFDLSPATIAAIKGGWTGLVIDQQEWLQGYLPILQIGLAKVYGFSGLHINTGAGFVDKSNVDFVAPLAAKNIR